MNLRYNLLFKAFSLFATLQVMILAEYGLANEPPSLPVINACKAEKEKFCPTEKIPPDIGKCLANHSKDLSGPCKQEMDRFLQVREQASAVGGGALSSFGGLNAMGPPIPLFSYDARYSGGEKGGSKILENKTNLSIPVYKEGSDAFTASLAGGQLQLDDGLRLDSGTKVPESLSRIELGVQYFHQLQEKRNWGLRGSLGYAGDKPFVSSKDMSFSLSGSYGFPGLGNGYWMAMVLISNNSPFLNYVPIPGIVYIYKTSTFTGMFGFPIFAMQWTPVEPWSYSLAILGPTVQSEVTYGHRNRVQVFTGYSLLQQRYILSERTEDRDRLMLQEQKVAMGVRLGFINSLPLEIQAGRIFGRSVSMGNGFFNKDRGSVSLSDDWVFNVGMKYVF